VPDLTEIENKLANRVKRYVDYNEDQYVELPITMTADSWAKIARITMDGYLDLFFDDNKTLLVDTIISDDFDNSYHRRLMPNKHFNLRIDPTCSELYVNSELLSGMEMPAYMIFRQNLQYNKDSKITVFKNPDIFTSAQIEENTEIVSSIWKNENTGGGENGRNYAGIVSMNISGVGFSGLWTPVPPAGQITYRQVMFSLGTRSIIEGETQIPLDGFGDVVFGNNLADNNRTGQVNEWEIHVEFTGMNGNANYGIDGRLRGETREFEAIDSHSIYVFGGLQQRTIVFRFTTISGELHDNHAGSGDRYVFEIGIYGTYWAATSNVNVKKIVRKSSAIENA
jgi:hypothetical protein